jgi:hypothetical protein
MSDPASRVSSANRNCCWLLRTRSSGTERAVPILAAAAVDGQNTQGIRGESDRVCATVMRSSKEVASRP